MIWLILALVVMAAVVVAAAVVAWRCIRIIPTGYVGLITHRLAAEHPQDRFEVRTHGSPGPQAQLLRANRIYFRPPWLYVVQPFPLTEVEPGTIGVVVALHGTAMPPDRQLARHVECANYADARAFLLGGGEVGRQPRVLTNGHHAVNPFVFEVVTKQSLGSGSKYGLTADDLDEIVIPPANTGVVTVHEGLPRAAGRLVAPVVQGHASFQYPDRFLAAGGMIGTQEQTLDSGGTYRINPWFAAISLMPTKELMLHWRSGAGKPLDNFDAQLDRMTVSVEGIRFTFDVSQTLRIPPETAPRLVARLGDSTDDAYGYTASRKPAAIKRFVEGVLSHIVEGSILSIAREYSAGQFFVSHAAIQSQLVTKVQQALAEWGVTAGQTTLSTFETNDSRLVEQFRDVAVEEERHRLLDRQIISAGKELDIAKIRDEIERGRLRLRSVELQDMIELLGRDAVAMERFLIPLASMRVPEVVAGSTEGLLNYLPQTMVLEMARNSLAGRGDRSADGPRRLIPVYVMLDESSAAVEGLDAGMQTVYRALADAPHLADTVRLSVVGYAGDVVERLSPQQVHAGTAAIHLQARGAARLDAAFAWLRDRVPGDTQRLKDQQFSVRRPQVLFLSAAPPAEAPGWQPIRGELTSHRYSPDIIACGIGPATANTVAGIATRADLAFVARDTEPVAADRFCDFVRSYVLLLGRSALNDEAPRCGCPDGFRPAYEVLAR